MSLGIIIFLIFFLLLALLRLDLALFFIIAALPTYLIRFSVFGLPSTLLEAMILITFAIWFVSRFWPYFKNLIQKKVTRIPYPFSWEIIALIIISFLSVWTAGFSNSALGIFKAYFFEPIILFILTINIYKERKDWTKITWALLVSALTIALLAIYQKISGQFIFNEFWANEATRRVVSWFGYPNAIGLYLAPLSLIFYGWFFYLPYRTTLNKSLQKLLIILTIITSILAIYFAHSEGALIGLAVGLFVFGLLAGRKQRTATIIITLMVVGGIFYSSPTRNLLISKLTLNDLSGQIRKQQWKETFLALQGVKIITGAGLNNYQETVKPVHQEGIFFNSDNLPNFDSQVYGSSTLRAKYWQPVEIYLYPHNIILNFWSELGLFGALVFVWLILKYLYLALKLIVTYNREKRPEKYLALGLFSAMIVIIIHGLVDVPYFKNDLSAMFWILLSFLSLLYLQAKYGDKKISN